MHIGVVYIHECSKTSVVNEKWKCDSKQSMWSRAMTGCGCSLHAVATSRRPPHICIDKNHSPRNSKWNTGSTYWIRLGEDGQHYHPLARVLNFCQQETGTLPPKTPGTTPGSCKFPQKYGRIPPVDSEISSSSCRKMETLQLVAHALIDLFTLCFSDMYEQGSRCSTLSCSVCVYFSQPLAYSK